MKKLTPEEVAAKWRFYRRKEDGGGYSRTLEWASYYPWQRAQVRQMLREIYAAAEITYKLKNGSIITFRPATDPKRKWVAIEPAKKARRHVKSNK